MSKREFEKEWLPETYNMFCRNCKTNVDFSAYVTKELIKHAIVFKDPGYGQEDEYADVTYAITYYVCPNCNKTTEHHRTKIAETNRRRIRC